MTLTTSPPTFTNATSLADGALDFPVTVNGKPFTIDRAYEPTPTYTLASLSAGGFPAPPNYEPLTVFLKQIPPEEMVKVVACVNLAANVFVATSACFGGDHINILRLLAAISSSFLALGVIGRGGLNKNPINGEEVIRQISAELKDEYPAIAQNMLAMISTGEFKLPSTSWFEKKLGKLYAHGNLIAGIRSLVYGVSGVFDGTDFYEHVLSKSAMLLGGASSFAAKPFKAWGFDIPGVGKYLHQWGFNESDNPPLGINLEAFKKNPLAVASTFEAVPAITTIISALAKFDPWLLTAGLLYSVESYFQFNASRLKKGEKETLKLVAELGEGIGKLFSDDKVKNIIFERMIQPGTFEFQLNHLFTDLYAKGVTDEARSKFIKAIPVRNQELQADPLTDKDVFRTFIRDKYGNDGTSIGKLLANVLPELDYSHPLKKYPVPQTIGDRIRELKLVDKARTTYFTAANRTTVHEKRKVETLAREAGSPIGKEALFI